MPDQRTYYAVPYRLDGSLRYFVWYSEDEDGVLLVDAARLATFPGIQAIEEYLGPKGLALDPDRVDVYDFDRLADWLRHPTLDPFDCPMVLDLWNMMTDIARSVSAPPPSANISAAIYDKLFWASNIPALTPKGQMFDPVWSDAEIAALVRTLSSGLAIIRQAMRYAG